MFRKDVVLVKNWKMSAALKRKMNLPKSFLTMLTVVERSQPGQD